MDSLELLTKREKEIFYLILEGQSSSEIAKQLYISVLTVKKHRKNIIRKLGTKGKLEFLKFLINFPKEEKSNSEE